MGKLDGDFTPKLAVKTRSLIRSDVVGELILVTGMARKMFSQQRGRAIDAVQNAFGEIAAAEMRGNFLGDFLPKCVAALGMNSRVADNRKLPDARSHENQNTILLFGFVHAEMDERLLRRGHGVIRFLAAD